MSRLPPGIDQQCDVYGRDPTSGKYTSVVTQALACRLAHLGMNEGVMTGAQRRELASVRALFYDVAFTMPENAQVEVAGIVGADGSTPARWNVEAGSVAKMRGPSGAPMFGRCIVIRAAS